MAIGLLSIFDTGPSVSFFSLLHTSNSAFFLSVLGGILVHIHSIVDGCDGEVARLKLRQTKYGG